MNETLKTILIIIGAVLASSGFWSWVMSRKNKDTAERRLLKGLAHDRILYLGNKYLQRGNWITADEFENLNEYLYSPYRDCGGNGTAEKIISDVKCKLTIVKDPPADYKSPC